MNVSKIYIFKCCVLKINRFHLLKKLNSSNNVVFFKPISRKTAGLSLGTHCWKN